MKEFKSYIYTNKLFDFDVLDFRMVGIQILRVPAMMLAAAVAGAPPPRDFYVDWGGGVWDGPVPVTFLQGLARIRLGWGMAEIHVPIAVHPAWLAGLAAASRSGQAVLRAIFLGGPDSSLEAEVSIPRIPGEALAILRQHPPVPQPLMVAALRMALAAFSRETPLFGIMEFPGAERVRGADGETKFHLPFCPGLLERGERGEVRCRVCGTLLASAV